MEDARQLYKAAERKCISIYAADTYVFKAQKHGVRGLLTAFSLHSAGYWQFMTARPKRPLSSIILDPGVKERILNDARNFLACRKWYSDRGIPYRRGYLLVSRVSFSVAVANIHDVTCSMAHPALARRL